MTKLCARARRGAAPRGAPEGAARRERALRRAGRCLKGGPSPHAVSNVVMCFPRLHGLADWRGWPRRACARRRPISHKGPKQVHAGPNAPSPPHSSAKPPKRRAAGAVVPASPGATKKGRRSPLRRLPRRRRPAAPSGCARPRERFPRLVPPRGRRPVLNQAPPAAAPPVDAGQPAPGRCSRLERCALVCCRSAARSSRFPARGAPNNPRSAPFRSWRRPRRRPGRPPVRGQPGVRRRFAAGPRPPAAGVPSASRRAVGRRSSAAWRKEKRITSS